MHFALYLTALTAPLATLAAPADTNSNSKALTERQTSLMKPAPCVRNNSTTLRQTKKRAKSFAHAFIYAQNITEAFTYIVSDYIARPPSSPRTTPHPPTSQLTWSQNHNPLAQNGSDSAWSILSPIWASQILTPQRTTFQGSQSWLEYENAVFGKIVDRFRWEGGCIVEHWDQGEVFPSGKPSLHA